MPTALLYEQLKPASVTGVYEVAKDGEQRNAKFSYEKKVHNFFYSDKNGRTGHDRNSRPKLRFFATPNPDLVTIENLKC